MNNDKEQLYLKVISDLNLAASSQLIVSHGLLGMVYELMMHSSIRNNLDAQTDRTMLDEYSKSLKAFHECLSELAQVRATLKDLTEEKKVTTIADLLR